ncbi:AP-3 complex subunit mu [Cryptococcus deuterogattii R265]|uniref:AP-3 complex subunit mu n=1 Tax=Cryptococcus deuterogattii (strain R265) TaxID=294750 RepID=UPI0019357F5B|nr:AP-3 complex subunit mu [Cryptococcus deuterogattii R265]
MSKIDGIIILDTNGKPIICSNFTSHPLSYATAHIDTFNEARKRALVSGSGRGMDPVLWVNTLERGGIGMSGGGLCHSERNGLYFLVPIGQEVNPLFAFSFLESFVDILRDYLGDVTEMTIKDNFDIVYMLIEETLDEGHPMTTETEMLKEIVLPPSLVRKIFGAAGVSGLQSTTTAPFTAPIPWRRPGVRHNSNEIYFDIEESLDAVVDKKGNTLTASVWGRINCNSRLSGNPDLLLSFSDPKRMHQCSFHPCVRYDGVLSFIPPDGKFRLLEYESVSDSARAPVPIQLKAGLTIEDYGGRFTLTLSSRLNTRPLEDINVSIFLGQGATSVSANASGERRPLHIQIGKDETAEGFVGGGNWEFDPHTQIVKWHLASLVSTERSPTLTGTFTSSEARPIISPSFDVDYTIKNYSYSNLRVDQLKVQGDVMYRPFKGVKMIGRAGKIEVRW